MAKDMMKKLRKSSRKEGVPLPLDLVDPKPTINQDLASDAQQFSQDFDFWCGKVIFGNIVAEIVQRHHLGHTAVNLLDTLDLVIPRYATRFEKNYGETGRVEFYRYICNTRLKLPDEDWTHFLKTMSGHVASACRILRNEKIPELSGDPVDHSTGESRASTPTTNESDENSSSPSLSPSMSPRHQAPAGNSITTEGSPDPVPPLQLLSDAGSAPDAPPTHRYTSALKEYADIHGPAVTYDKNQLSAYPTSWHCVAKFGDFVGEGIGSSFLKAKHKASKQICDKIRLQVK